MRHAHSCRQNAVLHQITVLHHCTHTMQTAPRGSLCSPSDTILRHVYRSQQKSYFFLRHSIKPFIQLQTERLFPIRHGLIPRCRTAPSRSLCSPSDTISRHACSSKQKSLLYVKQNLKPCMQLQVEVFALRQTQSHAMHAAPSRSPCSTSDRISSHACSSKEKSLLSCQTQSHAMHAAPSRSPCSTSDRISSHACSSWQAEVFFLYFLQSHVMHTAGGRTLCSLSSWILPAFPLWTGTGGGGAG